MIIPSILIVPGKYNNNKLISQIPVNESADFTVSRLTTATRVNSNGLINLVTNNVPRIDYLNQSCPALLVEPSAQNLVPNGVGFNSVTGVQTSSVTDSPAAAISGTLCTKNEASGTIKYVSQIFSATALSSATTYSVSRFFKYNGVAFSTTLEASSLTQWGNVAWKQVIVLSAASGVTLGASSSCTGSVENFGNGWYRVNVRVTTGATIGGAATVNVLSELPAALSTGEGFLTACPQLEVGSIATSYIPTTSGIGSRDADVISASSISSLIGQNEGTIYCEYIPVASGPAGASFPTNIITSARNVNTNTGFSITHRQSDNRLQADFFIGDGTFGAITTLSGTVAFGNVVKVAFAYKTGNFALAINGNVVQTTSVAFTSVTTINTIELTNPTAYFGYSGTVRHRAAALYTTRLSNNELQLLTKL